MENRTAFGTEKISRLLLRLAPPVMLAQLIQALYNIMDSFFVGKYSASGLTALSIIYPIQLLMIALAVGTGVGINTNMAAKLGVEDYKSANKYAGVGTPLAVVLWFIFALVCWFIMPFYAEMSTSSSVVIHDVVVYGRIDDGFSHELIMEALKEAIYNGVTSLRYIEKILYEWRKKGYKNKKDIQEAKEKYRESKKETKDYFFYDWINDD